MTASLRVLLGMPKPIGISCCGLSSVLVWDCSLVKISMGKGADCLYSSAECPYSGIGDGHLVQNLDVCIPVAVG